MAVGVSKNGANGREFELTARRALRILQVIPAVRILMNVTATSSAVPRDAATNDAAPIIEGARWPALLATCALLVICATAFSGAAAASSADCAALFFVALCGAVAFWPRWSRHFWQPTDGARDAATFALLAAMFVIYPLARNVGPGEKWALHFALTGEDAFPISYAACVVMLAAPIAWFGQRRARVATGLLPAIGAALGILAFFGVFSFRFLSNFYVVGATEELDPTPLVHLLLQCVEFGALSIVCGVAMNDLAVRKTVLRALPLLLLALWARHQFAAPPVEDAE